MLAWSLLATVAVAGPANAQQSDARVSWADSGITVRFPRAMSPDSITREMRVLDNFSGYEWRVILLDGDRAWLSALVVPPDDSLALHRYTTIKEAYFAGDLRQCSRDAEVLVCDRPARGLVRDVDGQVEISIVDGRWIAAVLQARAPLVRLLVKRNREDLWSEDFPLSSHR